MTEFKAEREKLLAAIEQRLHEHDVAWLCPCRSCRVFIQARDFIAGAIATRFTRTRSHAFPVLRAPLCPNPREPRNDGTGNVSDLDLDSLSELEERCLVNGGLTDAEIRDVFSLAREARRLREGICMFYICDNLGSTRKQVRQLLGYDPLDGVPVVSTEETP